MSRSQYSNNALCNWLRRSVVISFCIISAKASWAIPPFATSRLSYAKSGVVKHTYHFIQEYLSRNGVVRRSLNSQNVTQCRMGQSSVAFAVYTSVKEYFWLQIGHSGLWRFLEIAVAVVLGMSASTFWHVRFDPYQSPTVWWTVSSLVTRQFTRNVYDIFKHYSSSQSHGWEQNVMLHKVKGRYSREFLSYDQ